MLLEIRIKHNFLNFYFDHDYSAFPIARLWLHIWFEISHLIAAGLPNMKLFMLISIKNSLWSCFVMNMHIYILACIIYHTSTLLFLFELFFCMTEVQPIVCNVIPTANNGKWSAYINARISGTNETMHSQIVLCHQISYICQQIFG